MSLSSPAVCELVNVTYRQLNYWTTCKWIVPTGKGEHSNWAAFEPEDVARVAVLCQAGRAGLDLPTIAAALRAVTIPPRREGFVVIDTSTLTPAWIPAGDLGGQLTTNPGPHVVIDTSHWLAVARGTSPTSTATRRVS